MNKLQDFFRNSTSDGKAEKTYMLEETKLNLISWSQSYGRMSSSVTFSEF